MTRLLAIFILVIQALTAHAAVNATLDRQSIAVGDTANLQIRISGGNVQSVPNFTPQPNLTIQYAGQGSEIYSVNGQTTRALVLSYGVTASAPGTYTIPSLRVPIDGTTYTTQPIAITVSKDDGASQSAFIRIIPAKTNVYVGEMFPIEIKVYGFAIDELHVPALKSDGFTIGVQGQGTRSREQLGNNIYNVYTFPVTVSAAKAGNITLGPAETPALIRVQSNTRRNVFDEFFGGFQRRQVTLTSEPITVRVNPLPSTDVPPSFNGAVGNFQLAVKASATNVAVGDPITLAVQIRGRGAFDSLKLPDLNWKDFTFYQPNVTTTNLDALGLQAIKSFDQVVVPQRAGISAIPALLFSFFDPDQRAYKTIQAPPIPITVRATGHGQAQPTVVADQATTQKQDTRASDIVHIKPLLGQLSPIAQPLPLRPWFALLQAIPIALWVAATMYRKRANQLASDPRLRRKLEVAKTIAEGLPQLRQAAASNDSQKFFATGFRLLQEQIGQRLDLPAAAITEAVLDDDKLKSFAARKCFEGSN